MSSFPWKGKAPDGTARSERVWAENAQAARIVLEQRGWSDLCLLTDELFDAARAHVEGPDEYKPELDPEEEVALLEGKAPGFWSQFGKTVFDSKVSLVLFSLIAFWGYYSGRKWPLIFGLAGLGFMVLLFPILHAWFSLPGQYYAQLNRAKVWSRWDEVLRCVERLRKVRGLTRIGPAELELVRCRAQALAATGRLDDGLKEFAEFEADPSVPRWTYLSFLAGIHDCAKDYGKSLEYRRRATVEKPENSAVWTDLAYGLVRGLNRPAEAREALARAEALEVTQLGIPYHAFLRGVICWREGKFAEARQHLETALPGFKPFEHNPLIEGMQLLTKSYLCAVLGELGEPKLARGYFQQTAKFLKAAREHELLEACRAGLEAKARA